MVQYFYLIINLIWEWFIFRIDKDISLIFCNTQTALHEVFTANSPHVKFINKIETNLLHRKPLEACNFSIEKCCWKEFFKICPPTIVDTYSNVNQSFEKRSCEILAVKTFASLSKMGQQIIMTYTHMVRKRCTQSKIKRVSETTCRLG